MSAALKRFGPLALLLAALAAFWVSGWARYLTFDSLRAHHAALLGLVRDRPAASLGAYVLIYAAAASVSFPGETLLTLAGGFLFGAWLGGSATVVGATAGALVIFQAAKSAFGEALRARAERQGGKLQKISEGMRGNAFSYILSLRLVPLFPFWLVNVAAGVANAPLRAYALATFIGIMPATFFYSAIGSGLGKFFDQGRAPDLARIFQHDLLLPLIGLAALSLLPLVVRLARTRPKVSP